MRKPLFLFIYFAFFIHSFISAQEKIVLSNDLNVVQLTEHVFLHTSYLMFSGKRYPCNGIIFMSSDSAVVIDTPVNDTLSEQLLAWIVQQGLKIITVIPTHFHVDNLGGLKVFHEAGIPSYASALTLKLAAEHQYEVPENSFTDSLDLSVGKEKIECWFPGAGHTLDNIVVWIPSERILFGGCLVKPVTATGLGNTADADVNAWPQSIQNVIERYPQADIVVPGHGDPGGKELLDHTHELLATVVKNQKHISTNK